MKLHLARAAGANLFSGYGEGYVAVNGVRHERSIVVLPDRVIADWAPASLDALEAAHLAPLVTLGIEILLLGTGARLRFPRPEVIRPLTDARIGFEAMDAHAAARTYNILTAEGRRVAAALLLP
ncbi:MAG: Mth938-like domain-containing protein [Burkholderiales bacterium]|nr:Mth938-like domain-containing protein [Burkholderiales bacterium]